MGWLALIVAVYLAIGGLYAIYTPPWQVPDEPAHYNYIAQVVNGGCCPVITPGDYDQVELEYLKAHGFPEDADLSDIEYEDHQPPLFYLIAAPLFAASDGNLTALRLFSVLIGAGVVIVTFLIVVRLWPERPMLALAAAAFVAFVPQHVAMMAGVNNDGLAELEVGLALLASLAYLGNPVREGEPSTRRPHPALLGLAMGACLVAKTTAYLPAAAAIATALILRWRCKRESLGWLAREFAWAGGITLLVGGAWWVRNVAVYGWPDLLGLETHDQVVIGQLRTTDAIGQVGLATHLGNLLTVTFHSFWGQFGWMGVPMPRRTYQLLGIYSVWVFVGCIWLARGLRRLSWERWAGLTVLSVALGATILAFAGYNLAFVQFQGRYLFPALPVFGLVAAGGASGWARWLDSIIRGEKARQALEWLPLAATGWLALLALYALFHDVVPNLQ
jgi:4-amino-4-deoxy-L-arabinose transferase-like glycosyltransferase